jgi:hypothetical protein
MYVRAEQARFSANDWHDESDVLDSPPRSLARDWRSVTIAASARLANRVHGARSHTDVALST